MLARFVFLYLAHTWEVPPELHGSAIASANRRYGNYWDAVDDRLAGKDRGAEARRSETADAP